MQNRPGLLLFLLCLALYSISSYGGARSPDSEAVVSAAESLLYNGTMGAATHPVLKSAGFAKGRDGLNYPVFGPALSVALVPALALGPALTEALPDTVLRRAPINYYLTNGFSSRFSVDPLQSPKAHWNRLPAALMNAVFAALAAVLFWQALLWLGADRSLAALATGMLAFASPLWPYAETMFSEPLALATTLASFAALARLEGPQPPPKQPLFWALGSGLALGLAVTCHLSAILFAPFFLLWLWLFLAKDRRRRAISLSWLCGLGVFLLALGLLNYARFGDFLETGRTVDPEAARMYGYGVFVAPWKGLWGLLISSGKGMLIFAPVTIASFILLIKSPRNHRPVIYIMLGAVLFRLLFLAARSDWHGGFSPGPRYLLLAYPFLLLPVAFINWRSLEWRTPDPMRSKLSEESFFGLLIGISLIIQAELVAGDIFAFYFQARDRLLQAGLSLDDIFAGAAIYTDERMSPLGFMLHAQSAPLLARLLGLGFWTTWLILIALGGSAFYVWMRVASESWEETDSRLEERDGLETNAPETD